METRLTGSVDDQRHLTEIRKRDVMANPYVNKDKSRDKQKARMLFFLQLKIRITTSAVRSNLQNFAKVTTRQKPLEFTCRSTHIFSSYNILSYVDLA